MDSQMQEQMNRMQMQMQRMQEDMQRQMQMMQRSMMRPDMMGTGMLGLPSVFPTMSGMNALLDNPAMDMSLAIPSAPASFATAFTPKVDIRNEEKQMVVHAELPGMDKSDIKVDVKDNMLNIVAEHREDKARDESNWHLKERSYGKFHRCFRLPENIKDENITANFKDGVLEVMLPKVPEAIETTKKIAIQ